MRIKLIVMKKVFLLCILLVFFVSQDLYSQVRIVSIGNSITQAQPPWNSYRRPLWKMLEDADFSVDFVGSMNTLYNNVPAPSQDFDQDHEGHWGWRADEIINGRAGYGKLSDWLEGYTPDIALIHIGSNDAIQEQSTSSTIAQIETIIDILRSDNPGVTILLAQVIRSAWTPAISGRIQELSAAIPGIKGSKALEGSEIYIVDMNTEFNPAVHTYDNVHPNEAGEVFMAEKWFEVLEPILSGAVFIQPPYKPSAEQVSLTEVKVSWSDPDPSAEAIVIERSHWDTQFQALDTVSAWVTEYTDVLSESGEYTYRLFAYKGDNSSPKTPIVEINFVKTPPGNPQLSLTGKTSGSITMTLQPTGEFANGMRLQQAIIGSEFSDFSSLGSNGGSITSDNLEPSTTYRFRAYSFNFAGNSPFSPILEVTTEQESEPGEPVHYYWNFDSNTADINASGKSIELYSGAEITDFSLGEGKSLGLAGSSDYAIIRDFDTGSKFTVSFWAFSEDDSRNIKTFFGKGLSGGWEDGFKITYNSYLNNDRKIVIEMGDGSNEGYLETTAGLFSRAVWNHIAVSFDRTTSELKLYFNGEEKTLSGSVLNTWSSKGDYYLGSMENKSYFFDGFLDELQIYTGKILTEQEINTLYQQGVVQELPDRCFREDLELYPNPFEEEITISNKGPKAKSYLHATDGRLHHSFYLENGENKVLNYDFLDSGIYLLSVYRDDEPVIRKRLIKI